MRESSPSRRFEGSTPSRIRAALRCLLLCALPALAACGQVGELYQPPVEAPAEEPAENAAGPGGAS